MTSSATFGVSHTTPSRPVPVTSVGSDATSTASSFSLQTKSYNVEPEPENFDEWLAWLDETCALARRMGIERQIEWHLDQLAELALRWIEETA